MCGAFLLGHDKPQEELPPEMAEHDHKHTEP